MSKTVKLYNGGYFCGNKVSEYGLSCGYVDYRTLAKCFDMVLNNDIITETEKNNLGYWDIVNGSIVSYYDNELGEYVEYDDIEDWDNIEECYDEIYQYFIISNIGYQTLKEYTDEIVFYNETLDMYVWGVTHWGTSWDYVLTDIKIEIVE